METLATKQIEMLYKRHHNRLLLQAHSLLGNDEEANDVVSDVFAELLAKGKLLDEQQAESYLTVCVRNKRDRRPKRTTVSQLKMAASYSPALHCSTIGAGGSARIVQSLTQNLVHKYRHTPYFTRYNNFKSGPFSYYGYYNPLTLWNN